MNGTLELKRGTAIIGKVSLAHAETGTLSDEPIVWPKFAIALDGFRYARIDAHSPVASSSRIAWLDKQEEKFLGDMEFAIHPWTHLAKVLREQGHFREAADIDIAREDRLRRAARIGPRSAPFHWLYGRLTGYGYKPGRLIILAIFVWLTCGAIYAYAAARGVFGPTAPAIFLNSEFSSCRSDAIPKQASQTGETEEFGNWSRCPKFPAVSGVSACETELAT